jgi:hypothetical protein
MRIKKTITSSKLICEANLRSTDIILIFVNFSCEINDLR